MDSIMATPLRQLLNDVLFDPDSRSHFASDPGEYLRANGWENLEGPELEEAVAALGDGLPVETALALDTVTASVDFAAADLEDVGGTLAEVASQVDPDLPLELEVPDSDLAFGSGSADDTLDSNAGEGDTVDIDTLDSDTIDDHTSDGDTVESDPFDSYSFEADVTEPMVSPADDAGGAPGDDDLGLPEDDLDFGIDG